MTLTGSTSGQEIGGEAFADPGEIGFQIGCNHADDHVAGSGGVTFMSYGTDESSSGTYAFRKARDDGAHPSTSMVINAAGNVGIGTSSPDTNLELASTNTTLAISTYNDDGAAYSTLVLRKADGTEGSPTVVQETDPLGSISFQGLRNGTTFAEGAKIVARVPAGNAWYQAEDANDTPTELQFWTTSDGADNAIQQRMTIAETGFVGIGTAAPAYLLDVVISATTTDEYIGRFKNSSTGEHADILLLENAYAAHPQTTNSYIDFRDAGDLLDQLRGDDAGGIAETWTDASDARIKENINDLTGGLDKINALRPVSFNFIDDYLSGKMTKYKGKERWKSVKAGFIAQEFEQELPVSIQNCIEIVREDVVYEGVQKVAGDDIEIKKIDIKNNQVFQAYLVKAIQELSAKVEALENNNNQGDSNEV